MTRKPPAGILFLFLAMLPALPLAAPIADQAEMDRIVSAFYATTLDDAATHPGVTNLVIKKDIATFTLKSGTLYLGKPIEGAVRTAVFVGDGMATIKPVRQMDRNCLDMAMKDQLGKKTTGEISTAFEHLFIASMDDTIQQLAKSLPPAGAVSESVSAPVVLKEGIQMMWDLELPFDLELLATRPGLPDGPAYMRFKSADYGWLEYEYNPRVTLEVQVYSVDRVGTTVRPRPLIHTHKIADFDEKGSYIADLVKDQKDWIDVTKYVMQITIPDKGSFQAEGTLTFTPLIDNLSMLRFNLVNNVGAIRSDETNAKLLHLKSIGTQDGKPLPHVHKKHEVWVVPPEPLKIGTSYALKFSVDAQTIFQISSAHFFIVNGAAWFPQHGYIGGQAMMDWTVKAKKPLYATGSGRTIKETTEGQFNVTQLVFDRPVWLPFLIFGHYTKQTDVYQSPQGGTKVDLALFYAPRAEFQVEDFQGEWQTVPVTVPGGKPKGILGEAKDIIKFYEEIYGPFPFAELHVAQMAPGMGFGQGPAGFIQLTGEAFMSAGEIASFSDANADFFHEFFSHEVGHQYWAHNIKWGTDEDVWLSESFAEYSAGMFVMALLGPERFQGKIKEWKDRARLADPHGPVAWATNMSGENGPLWAQGLLYFKGPYIVHMLRMQVGHDNFVKAMKSLMQKYSHQQITTDMLRREFETVVGYKLDYFFDQWYRDTGIPTIDYSTEVTKTDDGKFLATVKLSQRDKAKVKIMSVPIFYHFGKDQVVVKNRPMLKAEDVYQIKLPSKPERISVDDHRTLLADIVAQGDAAGN